MEKQQALKGFRVNLPDWLTVLDSENVVITHALEAVKKLTKGIKTLEGGKTEKVFAGSPYFASLDVQNIDEASGIVTFNAIPHSDLFYRVVSEMTGAKISSEADVLAYITDIAKHKTAYDNLGEGLKQLESSGYGVVQPAFENFKLEKPTLYKSGKNYGVKLRASAPSIHMMRVDVDCEVAPIIGEQAQSEEMLKYLQSEFENNPATVWETPIFGKSLESIVREDVASKANAMPAVAKGKIQKTVAKIVNNGKGGVICILL